jgi:FtsP/CotA-like multicopper oxidase with cupredoxin domain
MHPLTRTIVLTLLAFGLIAAPAAAFSEPDVIRSKNGVLRTTLIAQDGESVIAGKRVTGTMTFNGKFPGPTLKVRPGDRLEIKFVNRIREATNLHFHGLHVSPAGKADNILRKFYPTRSYKISVRIPHNHTNGLYWYHPHLHGVVNSQVFRGLAGMISIEGGPERVDALRRYKQRLIGLNVTQFNADATALIDPNDQDDSTATTTVNSRTDQVIKMRPGQTELWRIANMSNEGFYKLQLDGHQMTVVGEDGHPVAKPYKVDNYLLPPGSRLEVLVKAGAAGEHKFRQLVHNDGFNTFPAQDLLTLRVEGDRASSPVAPRRLNSFEDLSRAKVEVRRKWSLSFSPNSAPVFKAMINGKTFSPDRVDTRARLGKVEEWTFVNLTTQDHPMHLHTNQFQVVQVNGRRVRPNTEIDNTILPRNGTIKIRFKPRTYTGLTVFHCHILFHEDSGMMSTIRYIKSGGASSLVLPEGVASVHEQAENVAQVFDPAAAATPAAMPANDAAHSHGHGTKAALAGAVARHREPGAPGFTSAAEWLLCPINE